MSHLALPDCRRRMGASRVPGVSGPDCGEFGSLYGVWHGCNRERIPGAESGGHGACIIPCGRSPQDATYSILLRPSLLAKVEEWIKQKEVGP